MEIIEGLLYTENHEWVKVEGQLAYLGITDYAQDNLGEIVFIELPEIHEEVNKGEAIAEVESVKAVSDIYSPLSGLIVEINEKLLDNPEELNQAPYENYVIVIEFADDDELEELMAATDYEVFSQ